jgi:hypothetical protein
MILRIINQHPSLDLGDPTLLTAGCSVFDMEMGILIQPFVHAEIRIIRMPSLHAVNCAARIEYALLHRRRKNVRQPDANDGYYMEIIWQIVDTSCDNADYYEASLYFHNKSRTETIESGRICTLPSTDDTHLRFNGTCCYVHEHDLCWANIYIKPLLRQRACQVTVVLAEDHMEVG